MQDARNNPEKYIDPGNRAFSLKQLVQIEKLKTIKCEYCIDLDEMEKEYPDEPHHGGIMDCVECGAQYYEEYGGKIVSCNIEARLNHPELEKL